MPDSHATPLDALVRRVWLVLAVSAVAFSGLALFVTGGASDRLDSRLLLLLRDASGSPYGPLWFEEAVGEVTVLGGYPVILIATAFGFAALLIVRRFAAAGFHVIALASGSVLSTALKLAFERGRPDIVEQLGTTFTSSFPSAHAMVSMLAWLTLAAVLARFVSDSSKQMAITDLVVLYQESVDHLQHVAGHIDDPEVLTVFEGLRVQHTSAVDSLSQIVQALGVLPRAPDVDKESLHELLVLAKATFSDDERLAFINDRIAANEAIRERLSQALSLEFDADTRTELERLIADEKQADEALRTLRSTRCAARLDVVSIDAPSDSASTRISGDLPVCILE